MELSDYELLQRYRSGRDEGAFAELVQRYINLVYSAAWRQLRDHHSAEDVTQAVFLMLAAKSGDLGPKVVLSSWLFQAARYASLNALKMSRRRSYHESAAARAEAQMEDLTAAWETLSPILDEAVAGLNETDRRAVLLRFFQNQSLKQVGEALDVSEQAARKRVDRAVDKLRGALAGKGVAVTGLDVGALLAANAVAEAPHGLYWQVLYGVSNGASPAALAIVERSLSMMAWIKIKAAALIIGAGIAAAAATPVVLAQFGSASVPPATTTTAVVAPQERDWTTVVLPNAELAREGKPTVLDFASGRLLIADAGERAGLDQFYAAGSGDVMYDGSLVVLRGGKAFDVQGTTTQGTTQRADGGIGGSPLPLPAKDIRDTATAFELPRELSSLLVTTRENRTFELRIIERGADGSLTLQYRPAKENTPLSECMQTIDATAHHFMTTLAGAKLDSNFSPLNSFLITHDEFHLVYGESPAVDARYETLQRKYSRAVRNLPEYLMPRESMPQALEQLKGYQNHIVMIQPGQRFEHLTAARAVEVVDDVQVGNLELDEMVRLGGRWRLIDAPEVE